MTGPVDLLPVEVLDVDPTNPRPATGDIDELVDSIRTDGILTPLIVRPRPDGRYGVLCGSRRLAAARQLGLDEVPCTVRDDLSGDVDALAVGLAENLHRRSLDPISEARAYRRLIEVHDLSQYELAARVGVSQPTVAVRLKLLELPTAIADKVAAGEISVNSAYRLVKKTQGPRDHYHKTVKRDVTVLDLLDDDTAAAVRTACTAHGIEPDRFLVRAIRMLLRELYRRPRCRTCNAQARPGTDQCDPCLRYGAGEREFLDTMETTR